MKKIVSKAKVPAPERAGFAGVGNLGGLGLAPTMGANNMKATKISDMSFKVDPEFHVRYKTTAAAAGLSMKELLEQSFQLWVASRK
jgi:DNA primase